MRLRPAAALWLLASSPAAAFFGLGGEAKNAPDGFRSQTVNGTASHVGLGWNQDYQWGNMPAEERPAWKPGSNRTGE